MGYTINDTDSRYNGWTNYATWRVNLEVFDGLDLRDHFDEIPDAYEVSQWAKGYLDKLIDSAMREPDGSRSRMFSPCDIVSEPCDTVSGWARAFFSDANWHEIAAHLLDAVKSEAA